MTVGDSSVHSRRPATILGPDRSLRKPKVKFPVGACDCHAHVFGSQDEYPYAGHAAYIAEYLPVDAYISMLRSIGCMRAVLVQPSVYGTDNRCLLDAMAAGKFDFRGVVVVDPKVSDAELLELHAAGVRGIRINAASHTPGLRMEHARELAHRIERLGWHLQFFINITANSAAADEILRLPVPCVIDHFGHVRAEKGIHSPEFQALLELAHHDHVWFKLSGGYRVSHLLPPFADVAPLAQALMGVAADRCVFGTDWPHPNVGRVDNDADLADALAEWVQDETLLHKVLVENPARLYQFD
ncbi:GntR family transcriptional regulator [Candidimonas nitroreducens]|uniref:GntR family transcriptional regulator n=1 Tax=Candidimonas nitroreducens TaxID=683354 RepID=A0A225MKN0_9BURK|nr:GntR family transcriptional regulator [Candidimonas nitroreducens]